MEPFTQFDRHSCFDSDDLKTVAETIKNCSYRNLENKLYGLYDGYLYNDLLELSKKHLSLSDVRNLKYLIDFKINKA